MSLTKIGSIGINTGIAFAGVTTITTLNGSDAVLSVGGTVNFVSDVSIGGTVSIAGTLTYEDVTNVDAVGLITARDGIVVGSGITLSVDGDIFATGVATATKFIGDGSELTNISTASTENIRTNTNATFLQNINVSGSTTTGSLVSSGAISGTTGTFTGDVDIADKIVHTGDTNTAIRFSGADTITAETGGSERLRIDSNGRLGVGDNSPDTALHVKSADNVLATFESTDADSLIEFKDNGTSDTILLGALGGDDLLFRCDAGNMVFHVADNSEKLRLDSSGRLLLGTTTEGAASGDDLTISNSGNMGLTLRSTDSNYCNIYFSDATSGTAEYAGYVSYQHSTDSLQFATASTERLRIDSSGRLGLGTNSPDQLLHIKDTSSTPIMRIQSSSYSSYIATIESDGNVSNGSLGANLHLRGANGVSFSGNGGTSTALFLTTTGKIEHVSYTADLFYTASVGGAVRLQFNHTGGGNITISNPSSGSVTYSTSSDYRLKENVTTINNALTTVKALRPYEYKWKHDGKLGQGFFAHEARETLPDIGIVSGTKDAVDSEGDPIYQQVDYSKLVPLLTAALQEAITKIEVLESEVAALKSRAGL